MTPVEMSAAKANRSEICGVVVNVGLFFSWPVKVPGEGRPARPVGTAWWLAEMGRGGASFEAPPRPSAGW